MALAARWPTAVPFTLAMSSGSASIDSAYFDIQVGRLRGEQRHHTSYAAAATAASADAGRLTLNPAVALKGRTLDRIHRVVDRQADLRQPNQARGGTWPADVTIASAA